MIDSHCHLDHDPLFENLSEILQRSKNIGIKKILTICTTLKSFENILTIIRKDEMIYGTFGIHPHETSNNFVTPELIKENYIKNEKIIGIGETGLDFFYNNSDKKTQISNFEKHIQAAIELKTPLIIHSRNAENETFDILNNFKNYKPKILMHCFTGSKTFANKLLSLDSFSASGIITFKIHWNYKKRLDLFPLRNYSETDSPFQRSSK